MENNEIYYAPASAPLKMERKEKLKIFAILAKHKDIPPGLVANKLLLNAILAYSEAEAIMGTQMALRSMGRQCEDYQIPFMIVSKELEKMVEFPAGPMREEIPVAAAAQAEMEADGKMNKSIDAMIAYVRYVFAEVGTTEEKEMSEAVITKFQEYGKNRFRA